MIKTLDPEQEKQRELYLQKFDEVLTKDPAKVFADEREQLDSLKINYTSISQRVFTQGAVVSLFFGLNLKPMKNVKLPTKLFLIALPLPVFFGYHYFTENAKYQSYKLFLATKYVQEEQLESPKA